MTMNSDFFIKLDQDKTCWEHMYQVAAPQTGGIDFPCCDLSKAAGRRGFCAKQAILFLKLPGTPQTHSRVLLRGWINIYKAKWEASSSDTNSACWSHSLSQEHHGTLWDLVPKKQQKIFISHKSSSAAPYMLCLKAVEPFPGLSLSWDELLKSAMWTGMLKTDIHLPRCVHLLIERSGEASLQAG